MSNRGASGDNDWVPIAAGVAVGAGLLALIYKLFFTGCARGVATDYNRQFGAPYKCTCKKGGREATEAVPETWGAASAAGAAAGAAGVALALALLALLYRYLGKSKPCRVDICAVHCQ